MRKTARPVVWEGAGAQSPAPDPIAKPSALLDTRFIYCGDTLVQLRKLLPCCRVELL